MALQPNLSDGDVLNANETYKLIGSNTNFAQVASGTGLPWTELGSVAIPAAATSEFIEIAVDYIARSEADGDGTTGASNPLFRISAGESGTEAVIKTYNPVNTITASVSINTLTTQGILYTVYNPSTDEKTNGFNVLIEGQIALTGTVSHGATGGISGIWVKGI